VAPAILLDTTESQWVKDGPDLKWHHGARDDLWRPCAALGQAHVDCDLIPYYVFSDPARTTLANRRVHIAKEDYTAVVLPGVEHIPAATIERLQAFYDGGGIVVAINRLPKGSCNGQEDERVVAAVQRIWGPQASGRGKAAVRNYDDLEAYLSTHNVPDVRILPGLNKLLYCHRQMHGRDLYFFVNTGAEPISTTVGLRGIKGVPTLWDPVTGQIAQAPLYRVDGDGLKVKLALDDHQSLFVVVDPQSPRLAHVERTEAQDVRRTPAGRLVLESSAGGPKRTIWVDASGNRHESAVALAAPPEPIVLNGPWQVQNRGDAHHRIFAVDVTLSADWPAGSPARLELQGTSQVVRVTINGHPAGDRFCAPYAFELGQWLQPGVNRLEIERVGRIVLPNAIAPPAKIDDDTVTAPARHVTLRLPSEQILGHH
jgi:hypothetical protein